MRTQYNLFFRISLLPQGVSWRHYEDGELVDDDDIFDEYECNEQQSEALIKELNDIYKRSDDFKITELKYTTKFECKLEVDKPPFEEYDWDSWYPYFEELLWPADLHDSANIFIDGKWYNIQLIVDDFVECLQKCDDDDEDE